MTLIELCEPLFQYMCRLNRSARDGVPRDARQVRAEVLGLLEEMKSRAASSGLSADYEKVRLPLIYFVDWTITESDLDFSKSWDKIAHDEQAYGGEQDFFEELEFALADQGHNADQRLAIFYTCMALGFSGFFADQPEWRYRKMQEIQARIRHLMDVDPAQRLCPEAYENTDTRVLWKKPGPILLAVAVALVALLVVLLIGNIVLYRSSVSELKQSFDTISGS